MKVAYTTRSVLGYTMFIACCSFSMIFSLRSTMLLNLHLNQVLEKQLRRLEAEQTRKRKSTQDFKRKLTRIAEENPEVGERLKNIKRQDIGRP